MDIKVARGLLGRMGVEVPSKSSAKKIGRKVLRAIQLKGEPCDLTGDERDLLKELQGGKPESQEVSKEDEKASKAAEPKSKKKRGGAKKATTSGEKTTKNQSRGGSEAFRQVFAKSSRVSYTDALGALVAAGVSDATAKSYICWAKRPIKDKTKNPFGIRIKTVKDGQGAKFLELV